MTTIGQENAEHSAEHRSADPFMRITLTQQEVDVTQDTARELTDAEKIEYLYQVALKVGALVDSITPAQVEQVQKLQRNPFLSKIFAGVIPGND